MLADQSDGEFSGKDRRVFPMDWNGKDWTVFESKTRGGTLIHRDYIDPQTHLIWRVTDTDAKTGKLMADSQVTDLKTNVTIDPTVFEKPKNP